MPPCAGHARTEGRPFYATWGIVYEFLGVVTHRDILGNRGPLTETSRHAEVAAEPWKHVPPRRGNLLHDAHTAILMREDGIRRIYTRDMDFHYFRSWKS